MRRRDEGGEGVDGAGRREGEAGDCQRPPLYDLSGAEKADPGRLQVIPLLVARGPEEENREPGKDDPLRARRRTQQESGATTSSSSQPQRGRLKPVVPRLS